MKSILMLTPCAENSRRWNQKRRSSIPRRASWVALEQAADRCNQFECDKTGFLFTSQTALPYMQEMRRVGRPLWQGSTTHPALSVSRSPCKPWDML